MINIIISILLIGFLIFIHELGHYSFARLFKVYVKEFAIGFPPRIIKKIRKGTQYSLGMIPFGGFVRLLGEDEAEADVVNEHGKNYQNIAWYKRLPILFGGIMFNIIFAWIGFYIILTHGNFDLHGEVPGYFKDFATTNTKPNVVYVEKNSLAEKAGLLVGDYISNISAISNSGRRTDIRNPKIADIKKMLAQAPDTLLLSITHADSKNNVVIFNRNELKANHDKLGVAIDFTSKVSLPLLDGIWVSFQYTIAQFALLFIGVAKFFVGLFTLSTGLDGVSGPLGIIDSSSSFVRNGFVSILYFMSFLSINLAALNLIPLPGLDGYHILVTTAEGVARKKIPAVIKTAILLAGILFILGLSILVTYFDVIKLIAR